MLVLNRGTQVSMYILAFGISGCEKNSLIIDNENVSSITVVSVNNADTFVVKNAAQITQIIKCLNHSNQEFVKFIPNYQLQIKYKDEVLPVSINGSSISMRNGKKYGGGLI